MAAQLGPQLLGGADQQRLELTDRGHPGKGCAASGGQQRPQRLPLTAPTGDCRAVLAERLTGGADGVQRVALGAGAAGWPLGPADLDHVLAPSEQEAGQAGAVAAGALDRPAAATGIGQVGLGEAEQLPVAGRIGAGRGLGEDAAEVGNGGGGVGVAVGVDADDAVDGLCQNGHVVVSLRGAAVVGVGLGGVTARHNCDGSHPHAGWTGC
jgi:hypothetical protein